MNFSILFLFTMIILGMRQLIILFLAAKDKEKKKVKRWIVDIIGLSYVVIFFGTICEYFIIKKNVNFIAVLLGMFLCLFGIWLQIWSFKSLGNNWSFYTEVNNRAKLITDGAYRYFRHPASLGFILEGLGIPLIANAFFIFIFACLIYFPLILFRVHIEEKQLIRRFGEDYLNFKKTTPFLVVFRR